MTLGNAYIKRLEQYLKDKSMTIYRFVKYSGISRSAITNLTTNNSRSPTLKTIYLTARFFNVSILEFLDCDVFNDENLEIE